MIIPPIPNDALTLIKRFEGLKLTPYICPGGFNTVGYGHKLLPGEPTTAIDIDTANHMLLKDAISAYAGVIRNTTTYLNPNQASALIDFVFNLGSGAYQRSTLRKIINRREFDDVPKELMKWCYAGGKKMNGLIRRRQAEADLFISVRSAQDS